MTQTSRVYHQRRPPAYSEGRQTTWLTLGAWVVSFFPCAIWLLRFDFVLRLLAGSGVVACHIFLLFCLLPLVSLDVICHVYDVINTSYLTFRQLGSTRSTRSSPESIHVIVKAFDCHRKEKGSEQRPPTSSSDG
ncbi:hypothetical protein HDV57DRAFT_485252 [Trichoderma longibrachiatum]